MSPLRPARARRRRPLLALAALPFLPACGASAGAPAAAPSPVPRPAAPSPAAGSPVAIQPVVPNTDLAVGRNRFTLGLLHAPPGAAAPGPLPDAQLNLKFFHPIEPRALPRGEAVTPTFRYVADRSRGLYVTQVEFDQPGDWGVEVGGTVQGRPLATARSRFVVKPKGDTPAIGAPAPRSRNPTRYDVDDIRKIDSGAVPNDMHEVSIAEAIVRGEPLVVLFASPGFCVSQTCAPQLQEVQRLQAEYAPRVAFVHVEIFKDPIARTPYETVTEWGLQSEPWTFIVDRQGQVAEKFEGPAPYAELQAALQPLL